VAPGGVDGAALAALLAALAWPAPVLRHHRDPARPPRHPLHRQAARLNLYSIYPPKLRNPPVATKLQPGDEGNWTERVMA